MQVLQVHDIRALDCKQVSQVHGIRALDGKQVLQVHGIRALDGKQVLQVHDIRALDDKLEWEVHDTLAQVEHGIRAQDDNQVQVFCMRQYQKVLPRYPHHVWVVGIL